MTPQTRALPVYLAEPDRPFWGYAELLLVAAVFIAMNFAGFAAVRALGGMWHFDPELGVPLLGVEFGSYACVFLAMKVLFARYGQPLFESLGWVEFPFRAQHLVVLGLVLAVVVVLLGVMLRLPNVETPFDKLLNDLPSRVAISVFGITLGPVIEELLFRGFLQPVLVDSFGALPGILATSVVFGAMHLMQNANLWQSGVLITLVGFVLGVVRHVSGSTRASAITHVSYNALPFVLMLISGGK
jgi:membrane protease YdiL (CAAX protease family)